MTCGEMMSRVPSCRIEGLEDFNEDGIERLVKTMMGSLGIDVLDIERNLFLVGDDAGYGCYKTDGTVYDTWEDYGCLLDALVADIKDFYVYKDGKTSYIANPFLGCKTLDAINIKIDLAC